MLLVYCKTAVLLAKYLTYSRTLPWHHCCMKSLKAVFLVVIGLLVAGMGRATTAQTGARPAHDKGIGDDGEPVDSPADVSPSGWKEALRRTKAALKDKNISTASAGLAYYATITFFPAMLGLATVYASFAGPTALADLIRGLEPLMPAAIYDMVQTQLGPLERAKPTSLGIAAAGSIAAVLWTTSGGLQNLVKATNLAYEVEEDRGMVKLRLVSLALTSALLLLAGLILVLLLLQGSALERLGAPHLVATLFPYLRWPLLIVLISVALSLIYRYAPNRQQPKWSWVSWGATAATLIWLAGTALFFLYAQNFGNFNKSYGTFAGIIILMVWFNLSALIILVGAQVNKKLEEVTDAETAAGS